MKKKKQKSKRKSRKTDYMFGGVGAKEIVSYNKIRW
jgi:hypothetical protein